MTFHLSAWKNATQRNASHHITSHQITSHHITSHHITLHHMGFLPQGFNCKRSERELPLCRAGRFPFLRQGRDFRRKAWLCDQDESSLRVQDDSCRPAMQGMRKGLILGVRRGLTPWPTRHGFVAGFPCLLGFVSGTSLSAGTLCVAGHTGAEGELNGPPSASSTDLCVRWATQGRDKN